MNPPPDTLVGAVHLRLVVAPDSALELRPEAEELMRQEKKRAVMASPPVRTLTNHTFIDAFTSDGACVDATKLQAAAIAFKVTRSTVMLMTAFS